MTDRNQSQVVVIGAGPGGYAAAFHAASLGLNVTLVNQEKRAGGVCLKRGCIPSKALLHIAKLVNEAREASNMGITFGKPEIDIDKLRAFKDGVIDKLAGGISQLAAARKVRYLHAHAEFAGSNSLKLTPGAGSEDIPETLCFEHCIIASGSSPAMPRFLDIGDERVMDSTCALELRDVPDKLLVIGGGYIGLEMGTVYQALGSAVSVVEMTSTLLPGADRDLVKPLQQRINKSFDKIMLETKVASLKAGKEGVAALLEDKEGTREETYDRVLVSVGRTPNTGGLGLENTRAEIIERGFIGVDARMQTADPSIFAIGDVAGEPMLAHKASKEAKVAAEVIAGKKTIYDVACVPAVVFTDPEIAWAGLTEDEAAEKDIRVEVGRFPWAASGRAATLARQEGLTKLIVDPVSGRILGVGMVGVGAGDMIAEGVIALEMAANIEDIAESIHPHPTLSETMMEAAEVYLGHSTHMVSRKK
jgi:dihydrolipoamide dehydrogenase